MIYFVEAHDHDVIKIGTTGDLASRLPGLRLEWGDSLRVLGVISGADREELILHSIFAAYHVPNTREWFYPGSPLLDFVGRFATPWTGDADLPRTLRRPAAWWRQLPKLAKTLGYLDAPPYPIRDYRVMRPRNAGTHRPRQRPVWSRKLLPMP